MTLRPFPSTSVSIQEQKVCKVCQKSRPLDDFYRYRKGREGRRSVCRDCNNRLRSEWRLRKYQEGDASLEKRERESYKRAAQREKEKRRASIADRIDVTIVMINSLRRSGLTYQGIADRAGVSRNTLMGYLKRRHTHGPHERVTKAIGDLYIQVLEENRGKPSNVSTASKRKSR